MDQKEICKNKLKIISQNQEYETKFHFTSVILFSKRFLFINNLESFSIEELMGQNLFYLPKKKKHEALSLVDACDSFRSLSCCDFEDTQIRLAFNNLKKIFDNKDLFISRCYKLIELALNRALPEVMEDSYRILYEYTVHKYETESEKAVSKESIVEKTSEILLDSFQKSKEIQKNYNSPSSKQFIKGFDDLVNYQDKSVELNENKFSSFSELPFNSQSRKNKQQRPNRCSIFHNIFQVFQKEYLNLNQDNQKKITSFEDSESTGSESTEQESIESFLNELETIGESLIQKEQGSQELFIMNYYSEQQFKQLIIQTLSDAQSVKLLIPAELMEKLDKINTESSEQEYSFSINDRIFQTKYNKSKMKLISLVSEIFYFSSDKDKSPLTILS